MENLYLLAICSGFAFGIFLGRFITKLKLALVYESKLKQKRPCDNAKIDGGE